VLIARGRVLYRGVVSVRLATLLGPPDSPELSIFTFPRSSTAPSPRFAAGKRLILCLAPWNGQFNPNFARMAEKEGVDVQLWHKGA
jgi:hypothetical protein